MGIEGIRYSIRNFTGDEFNSCPELCIANFKNELKAGKYVSFSVDGFNLCLRKMGRKLRIEVLEGKGNLHVIFRFIRGVLVSNDCDTISTCVTNPRWKRILMRKYPRWKEGHG